MNDGKISIIGYYGYANVGDEAILTCLVSQLRRMELDGRIVVFTARPEATAKTLKVNTVAAALPREWYMYVVGFLGRHRKHFYRTIQTFRTASALIVGGGGLFQDHPESNRHLHDLLFKIRWAKNLDQKVILFGVGVGPIHYRRSADEIRDVLNRVDLITVRDEESHRLLNEIGVSGPEIHTTADFVFLLDPAPKKRIDTIAIAEGIDSAKAPNIAVSIRAEDAAKPDFRESLLTLCRHLIDKHDARLWFVPMQTGGGEDDCSGAHSIIEDLNRPDHTRITWIKHTPPELMGLLERANAVIGEKLHSIIFAINNHRPVLGISYQSKIENLFAEIGHPDWCLKLENVTGDNLIERFDSIWSDRERIAREMKAIHDTMRVKALLNFTYLTDIMMR